MYYQIIRAGKEEIGLVWSDTGKKMQVEYIYLPHTGKKMVKSVIRDFPAIDQKPRKIPEGIDRLIADLYNGEKKKFDLSVLNLSGLSGFAANVLKLTFKIPRGKVATYASLAAKAGSPKAARAVGSVMANNPFPIVIPCHRVIRADGSVGQFGGGSNMKEQLLQKEGITFDVQGRIPLKYLCQ